MAKNIPYIFGHKGRYCCASNAWSAKAIKEGNEHLARTIGGRSLYRYGDTMRMAYSRWLFQVKEPQLAIKTLIDAGYLTPLKPMRLRDRK